MRCNYCSWFENDEEPVFLTRYNFGFFHRNASVSATIEEGNLVISGDVDGDFQELAKTKVNYCPMCGRKLDDVI